MKKLVSFITKGVYGFDKHCHIIKKIVCPHSVTMEQQPTTMEEFRFIVLRIFPHSRSLDIVAV